MFCENLPSIIAGSIEYLSTISTEVLQAFLHDILIVIRFIR